MVSQIIAALVEERVRDLLPSRVLDLMTRQHAKRAFKDGCECSYCSAKRHATVEIGLACTTKQTVEPRSLLQTSHTYRSMSRYAVDIIRDSLRQKHREILKRELQRTDVE